MTLELRSADPVVEKAPKQTPNEFTTEWGLKGGQVVQWNWLAAGLLGLLGFALMVAGVLGLFLFWPAGLAMIVVGMIMISAPNSGIWGAWHGMCPHCRSEIAVADAEKSAVLTPIMVVCPHCSGPVATTQGAFTAMTAAPPPRP